MSAINDVAADAADVVGEAVSMAHAAGVDIDAIHARAGAADDCLRQARELVSAALPLLEVRRFDCAQFSDGRLILEIDGVTHHLSAEQARHLFACMETGSHIE